MNTPSQARKHVVWALLTLGCVVVDVAVIVALVEAVKWFVTLTSPLALAAVGAFVIMAARGLWSVYSGVRFARSMAGVRAISESRSETAA